MPLPSLPLINGALFVSSSFFDQLSCPRAGEYYKLHNRILASDNTAQEFGKAIHSGLEMHSRCEEFGVDDLESMNRVTHAIETALAGIVASEEDYRNVNWACEIYRHYRDKYRFEDFNYLKWSSPQPCSYCKQSPDLQPTCYWCNFTGLTSHMLEVPFAAKLCEISGIPIYFHGIIDLPISLAENGQIFILDYKTTSMLGNSFWDDKLMSAQQKGYCWAFQQTTGMKVAGYQVRAIRTTPMPPGVRDSKPNRKGITVKQEDWWDEGFQDQKFRLGSDELDEWMTNACVLVEEFLWHYGRGYFPKKSTNCTGKFGRCQYFEVCNTFPVASREMIINSGLYKTKEPNKKLIKSTTIN